jgi:hypothetical protein
MNRDRLGLVAVVVGLVGVASLAFPSAARAMPNFARQYEVSCDACHTVIPRLNQTGYEFRRAGFRMPHEIGLIRPWEKERDSAAFIGANYFDARLQMNASYTSKNRSTDSGGYAATGGKTYTNSALEFKEFTLYPLTGGFLGHWATESEISGTTDEIEVQNGYLRYVTGKDGRFWQVRFGVFHPFEGFGASDRPIAITRPLFQGNGSVNALGAANGFTQWGKDETGLEGGFQFKNTSLSLTLFNGTFLNDEGKVEPAQGAGLSKPKGIPTENDKDIQLFFNQIIGKNGAAVSAYYYDGAITLGDPGYKNDFNRWAVYGSLPVQKFLFLAGYSEGRDEVSGFATTKSGGYFLEADNYVRETLGVGVRYDQFDPSKRITANTINAITAFVNVPLNNGVQFITELKSQKNEKGVGKPDQTTNSINVRVIYIW